MMKKIVLCGLMAPGLALAQQAMRQAATIIADQAELFAVQFMTKTLADRGAAIWAITTL